MIEEINTSSSFVKIPVAAAIALTSSMGLSAEISDTTITTENRFFECSDISQPINESGIPIMYNQVEDPNRAEKIQLASALTDTLSKGFSNSWSNSRDLDKMSDRIIYFGNKEDGWKGEGSLGTSRDMIVDALQLARKIAIEEIQLVPSIGLDEEGIFTFYWNTEKVSVILTIDPDHMYSYYALIKENGDELEAEEIDVSEPLDPDLLKVLSLAA